MAILTVHHCDLPKDAQTFLNTRRDYSVRELCGGLYHYIGIIEALKHTLSQWKDKLVDGCCLHLQMSVDGLPLFKSSGLQLWPILGRLVGVPMKEPVVIGMYSGIKKPESSKMYLTDLANELSQLQEGFTFEGKRLTLKVHSMICDAPAKSFVKVTKAFNGYYGCDKCIQSGVYLNHSMTYPLMNSQTRSDEAFARQEDEEHHHGPHAFTNVHFGLVSQVPLDYMHLVCLGVVRRLIFLWMKGPLTVRLPGRDVDRISRNLLSLRPHIPSEFARRPRALNEVDRWKATEFHQFLLYTGPVVLREVLSPDLYANFLLLSTAMAMLVSPFFARKYNEYANSLLHAFVEHFARLYGNDQLVYNVHGLTHLAQDAKHFGNLDVISSFPYENYLQKLKGFVRKPSNPLAQIIRRLSEGLNGGVTSDQPIKLCKEHARGPIPVPNLICHQYDELISERFTMTTTCRNNTFLMGKNVCQIINIIDCHGDIIIAYRQYGMVETFFTYPFNSDILNIVIPADLGHEIKFSKLSSFTQKCMAVPFNEAMVVIPLFHMKD